MQRRNYLKIAGGVASAAAAGGIGLIESSGAAMAASGIQSHAVSVKNDRGEVHKITIDPQFTVTWKGFDDVVAKVLVVIEARADYTNNGNWSRWTPIFRMTPWLHPKGSTGALDSSGPGTSGHYHLSRPLSKQKGNVGPLEVMNKEGRPDYASVPDDKYPAGSEAKYLNGSSMGHASAAETQLVEGQGLPLVNNYPNIDAGYYGAAGNANDFDHADNGHTSAGRVQLRYTFALLRPNLSYMESMYPHETGDSYDSKSDKEKIDLLAGETDAIEPGDVDAGNSAVVMTDQTSKNYYKLQNGGFEGVTVDTTKFKVSVENLPASASDSGSSNPSAN